MKSKKQTNAKKATYKGITFRSKLELYMYKLLESEQIPFAYEQQKFEIDEGFVYRGKSYEKFMNGRGAYKDRGKKKFAAAVYTPDFTPPVGEPLTWVIETKGRTFPDFARTWRLFKKYLLKKRHRTVLFLPRTQVDCQKTVEILKKEVLKIKN